MKESLPKRRAARQQAEHTENTSKLGSGSRFKAVEKSAKASGAKNPGAVAAAAGRKKYGAAAMKKLSAAGKKKK